MSRRLLNNLARDCRKEPHHAGGRELSELKKLVKAASGGQIKTDDHPNRKLLCQRLYRQTGIKAEDPKLHRGKPGTPVERAGNHPGERKLGRDGHYWISVRKPGGGYQWRPMAKQTARPGIAKVPERIVPRAVLDPTPKITTETSVQNDYREMLKACTWINRLNPIDMKSPANRQQVGAIVTKLSLIVNKYNFGQDSGLISKTDLKSLQYNCNRIGQLFKYLLLPKTEIRKDYRAMAEACQWLVRLEKADMKSPANLRRIAQISALTHEIVDKYDLNRGGVLKTNMTPQHFRHNCNVIGRLLEKML